MSTHPLPTCKAIARTAAVAAGAVAMSTLATPTASADALSGNLWNLYNSQHVSAGCPGYTMSQVLGDTAGDIAHTLANPPGGIAGNGRTPTDGMLANRGYYVTSWGEADYVNNSGNATPQDAINFWLANPTKEIFPNCNNHDLGTAVWIQNGKWVAVALTGTGGGTPPAPPEQPH